MEPVILIVDDNNSIREITHRRLNEMGYVNVIEATDGNDAVNMAKRHFPDLIIMDIQMPELDGITATRRILEYCPNAKVIMMTGAAMPSRVLDSRIAGATNFLLKPVNLNHFSAVISKMIPHNSMSVSG